MFLKKSDRRGYVTVFTALVLSAVCIFNVVLMDAASVISARHFCEFRTEMAAGSLLASYDSMLFSKFGLLGFNALRYDDFETDFIKYISEPLRTDVIRTAKVRRTGYELSMLDSLAEPAAVKRAVTGDMKYRTPANGAVFLAKALELTGDSAKGSGAALYIARAEEALSEAGRLTEELKKTVEGYFSGDIMCVNGYGSKNNILIVSAGKILLKIRSYEDVISGLTAVREALEEIKSGIDVYKVFNVRAVEIIYELKIKAADIDRNISLAESKIKSIQDGGSRRELEVRIAKLKNASARISNEGLIEDLNGNIEALNAKTAGLAENIKAVDRLASGGGSVSGPDPDDAPDQTEESAVLTGDDHGADESGEIFNAERFVRNVKNAFDSSDVNFKLSVGRYYINYDDSLSIYDTRKINVRIESLYRSDSYVIPDNIYDLLPSVLRRDEVHSFIVDMNGFESSEGLEPVLGLSDDTFSGMGIAGDAAARYMISDYVNSYFYDYSDVSAADDPDGFICMKEYIIAGHKDSDSNIRDVSNMLLILRFGFNFMHCLLDSEKHEFASAVGNAIAAAVSAGIGGELYAMLLMGAWALAESYADVQALRQGEKVVLVKTKETWKTSIEGLLSRLPGEAGQDGGTDNRFALDYTQYLIILTLGMPEELLLARIADVIEIVMSDYTGERYSLSAVFTTVRCRVRFVPVLISPVFKVKGSEAFEFEIEKRVSY